MITRVEAEEIAVRWARSESEQRGYECEPVLAEFNLGYVIWTRQPPTVLPVPGDGARTVIDRETGVLSTWPGIPPEDIAALYRGRRPVPSRTVDPSAALRRGARRRPSPATAAHLTADGRLFRAQGAKGDQVINHHPLVGAYLNTVDPGARVRGVERHAELIVVSDVLHEADRGRSTPITLDEARAWLITAQFESYLIRERGDPLGGRPSRPCETCIGALVHFALLPWSDLAFTVEWRHGSDRIPEPGRFPHEVARTLAGGGWMDLRSLDVLGDVEIRRTVEASGGQLRPFAAARRVAAEFPGVRCGRRGPGTRRAVRLLTLDPVPAAHTAATLAEFAQVVGAPLFPIGIEGGDAVVATDERGRVFVLDQAGEWFVGETLDEALVGLLSGDGPAKRIRDDGRW
ncbi:SUKH-3 domain-containing protein [Micromonosporaceae bacterium Da 78-11]